MADKDHRGRQKQTEEPAITATASDATVMKFSSGRGANEISRASNKLAESLDDDSYNIERIEGAVWNHMKEHGDITGRIQLDIALHDKSFWTNSDYTDTTLPVWAEMVKQENGDHLLKIFGHEDATGPVTQFLSNENLNIAHQAIVHRDAIYDAVDKLTNKPAVNDFFDITVNRGTNGGDFQFRLQRIEDAAGSAVRNSFAAVNPADEGTKLAQLNEITSIGLASAPEFLKFAKLSAPAEVQTPTTTPASPVLGGRGNVVEEPGERAAAYEQAQRDAAQAPAVKNPEQPAFQPGARDAAPADLPPVMTKPAGPVKPIELKPETKPEVKPETKPEAKPEAEVKPETETCIIRFSEALDGHGIHNDNDNYNDTDLLVDCLELGGAENFPELVDAMNGNQFINPEHAIRAVEAATIMREQGFSPELQARAFLTQLSPESLINDREGVVDYKGTFDRNRADAAYETAKAFEDKGGCVFSKGGISAPGITMQFGNAAEQKPQELEYKVERGDSPWKIAQEVYGHGADYAKILEANGLAKDHVLQPGDKLTIPEQINGHPVLEDKINDLKKQSEGLNNDNSNMEFAKTADFSQPC